MTECDATDPLFPSSSLADTPSQPRGASRPSFSSFHRPNRRGRREGRVPARTHGLLRETHAQKNRTAAYRCGRTHGLPCAMVGRRMPCSPGSRTFLWPPSPRELTMPSTRLGSRTSPQTGLTVATTARTTRFCRTQLIRLRQEASPDFSAVRLHAATGSQGLPALPAPFVPTLPRPPQPGPRFERLANRPSPSGRAV